MNRHYYLTAKENQTLEQLLMESGFSRDYIVFFRQHNDNLLVNKKPTSTLYLVKPLDEIEVILPQEEMNEGIIAQPMDLDVLYEDDDLLIVNKDTNIPVHPSKAHFHDSLANAVAYYQQQNNQHYGYHCITRLDTNTTGIVLLAKNPYIASLLNQQIPHIQKEYLAIVQGKTPLQGTIDKPIIKSNEGIKRIIDENGQIAITHFSTLYYDLKSDLSIIKLHLETGRTHQIRVHMSSIGHPLIGDSLYGGSSEKMNRQALHVYHIELSHPITSEPLKIHCPLPMDMQKIIDSMNYDLSNNENR